MNAARPSPVELLADSLRHGEWRGDGDWILAGAVQLLTDAIGRSHDALGLVEARDAVRILNAHLQYDFTCAIASAWERAGFVDIAIRKRHVQALINLGELDEAERLIGSALLPHTAAAPEPDVDYATTVARETLELQGLRARAAKDRFVRAEDAGKQGNAEEREQLLLRARDDYAAQYSADETRYWQGVNALALQARHEREFAARNPSLAEALAHKLVRQLKTRLKKHYRLFIDLTKRRERLLRRNSGIKEWEREHLQWIDEDANVHWLFASLSEACLALNLCDEAELWLYRFVHYRHTKPFDLNAYARQLREIWQADHTRLDSNCASRLAFILRRHLQAKMDSVSFTREQAQALRDSRDLLEKNFAGDRLFTVPMVERMLQVCASVGSVNTRRLVRKGTGFLIDRRQLWGDGPEGLVFVTNAHVMSETFRGAAVRPADAVISFEMDGSTGAMPQLFQVDTVLFSSDPGEVGVPIGTCDYLDVTVVTLKALPPGARGLTLQQTLPDFRARARAYVVGHPKGAELQISLHDSVLLDYDPLPRLIHYRTPTDPGSSGSPVFNEHWEVIGVHHAGSDNARRLDGKGTYEANEGIALSALCRKLASLGAIAA